jgi:hypothetical protein
VQLRWLSLVGVRVRRNQDGASAVPVSTTEASGCSIPAMTLYLTPFVLIGGLVMLGLLVGVGLVLLTVWRERADVGPTRDEAAEGTDRDRAA